MSIFLYCLLWFITATSCFTIGFSLAKLMECLKSKRRQEVKVDEIVTLIQSLKKYGIKPGSGVDCSGLGGSIVLEVGKSLK